MSELDALVDDVVEADDWPWAASSALSVEGEILLPGVQLPEPDDGAAGAADVVVVLVMSNEVVVVWLKPVLADDDELDDASD